MSATHAIIARLRDSNSLRAVALAGCLLGIAASGSNAIAAQLETADYVAIERLYGDSFAALESASDNGMVFARSFVAEGQFITTAGLVAGTKALADMAVTKRGSRYDVTNLFIEPSGDGALGWPYVMRHTDKGFEDGGLYRDALVKTPEGWRIKIRTYAGNTMPPREHQTRPPGNSSTTLTPLDYAEIQNVVSRYNLGYDVAGAWDQGTLASLSFTNDVVFERIGGPTRTGRSDVASQSTGTSATYHWDLPLLIGVSPSGEVTTFSYTLLFGINQNNVPTGFRGGGVLHHQLVKTSEGWLVKYRKYEPSGSIPAVNWPGPEFGEVKFAAEPKPAGDQLSSADAIAIKQLYVRNSVAFDSSADDGMRFARTFTPDGVLIRDGEKTAGQPALAAWVKSTTSGIHTWLTNLTIAPAGEGAKGRANQVSASIGFGPGAKTTLAAMGAYEDELVRTPDGWRFKQRTYTSDKSVTIGSAK